MPKVRWIVLPTTVHPGSGTNAKPPAFIAGEVFTVSRTLSADDGPEFVTVILNSKPRATAPIAEGICTRSPACLMDKSRFTG